LGSQVVSASLPKNRLRLDGVRVSKSDYETKIKDLLRVNKSGLTPTELGFELDMDRSSLQRNYLKPMLAKNDIKKVDGTHKYVLAESKVTAIEIKKELYNRSEVFQTEIFKNWSSKITSKKGINEQIMVARLCLGAFNQNFKLNPDIITKDNWKEVIANMRDAILQEQKKPAHPEGRVHFNGRQSLRHMIMWGLGIELAKKDADEIGLGGDKDKPIVADLHIKKEQIDQMKTILKNKKYDPIWFIKAGVKIWSGVRPSSLYLVETDSLEFYDRVVEYVEVNGERSYKQDILQFAKNMLIVLQPMFPQIKDVIKIGAYTHRACAFKAYEHKQKKSYQKFVYDEDFVIPLEKYWKERKFQKKKYLFWQNNDTVFEFKTYEKVVLKKVHKDNEFYKDIFLQIGFTAKDFGKNFRANYGFRHMAIQTWLIATDYDYDAVAEMFHEHVQTLKEWYGKPTKEHVEKQYKSVVA
jgi:hypothetical protein